MKAFKKCLAAAVALASVFTLSGCAKNTASARVATTANWNTRVSTVVEKDSLDFWQSNMEVAQYSASFKANENSKYSLSYDTAAAEYTTWFYAEAAYDWTSTDIPEEYRSEEAYSEPVYVLKTEMKIHGVFKMNASDDEKQFDDELVSECKFRLAGDNLQPVYSYQKVVNTSPNHLSPNSISQAYVQVDSVYEIFYNRGCSQAIVKTTDNLAKDNKTSENKISLSTKAGYSVFDNSQLIAAFRSFTKTGGSSRTFNTLVPQNLNTQISTATVSLPIELNPDDEEQKGILDALTNAPEGYVFFDGTPSSEEAQKKNIRFNAVSLGMNAYLTGQSPTYWYSTVENADVNTTRCVLLKTVRPLSFGLGTLSYTLKSLNVEKIEK
ncbi:MAG: hypothetical protein K2N14_00330 [Clostridia bacterium]|nr:hypothetical protein [Clostridia bacterium]